MRDCGTFFKVTDKGIIRFSHLLVKEFLMYNLSLAQWDSAEILTDKEWHYLFASISGNSKISINSSDMTNSTFNILGRSSLIQAVCEGHWYTTRYLLEQAHW